MLYRLFPHDPAADPREEGGALHVPRLYQGAGRHDNPERYGALYATRTAAAAVAERLAPFAGAEIGDDHLVGLQGRRYALATIDDGDVVPLPELDDPAELVARELRPSSVATRDREVTQPIALRIYDQGHVGFAWWSTLEASWINVTLFAERALARLGLAADPDPLTLDHPALRDAADALGVPIE